MKNRLAVELGGGMLPEAKDGAGDKASSWYGYGALRMDASINNMDKLNLFMKGGVAYRDLHLDGTVDNGQGTTLHISDSDNYVTYIFGAGASYDITSNIYVALEGDFIGGKDKNEDDSPHSPGASVYMMKLGYNFSF